jgi:NitT/TauT family transport system substrate-binding protein
MKKRKNFLALALLGAGILSLCACQSRPGQSHSGLTPVTLNEVAHSIFYAPQYAAIELGYFEEEGIDLTLVNGAGADKVMTALVSGDADIGFMGSEASIYTYAGGAKDYAVNFAQLTQRAGNFLVGRTPDPDFSWEKLKGSKVLGGRAGGMPSHDGTWEHIRGIYQWTSRKAKSGGYGESGKGCAGKADGFSCAGITDTG